MKQSPQYNDSKQSQRRGSRGNVFSRTVKLANYIYLKILVPYLDSPSEESISTSSKLKEQHETAHF